jgi:ribosome maturation factor RimP
MLESADELCCRSTRSREHTGEAADEIGGRKPTFYLARKQPGSEIGMAVELDKIRAAAERVAASHHLEVVDVSFTGAGKYRALQIFIEKDAAGRAEMVRLASEEGAVPLPKGVPVEALSGVTHEECATFAHDFGTLLDVEDLITGTAEYTLEVSSPGVERNLFKATDYARFAGSLVKLKTFQPIKGSKNFTGRMTFKNDVVMLDLAAMKKTRKKAGAKSEPPQTVEIALAQIESANLIAEI